MDIVAFYGEGKLQKQKSEESKLELDMVNRSQQGQQKRHTDFPFPFSSLAPLGDWGKTEAFQSGQETEFIIYILSPGPPSGTCLEHLS